MDAQKSSRWDKAVGIAIAIGCCLAVAVGVLILRGSIVIWPHTP